MQAFSDSSGEVEINICFVLLFDSSVNEGSFDILTGAALSMRLGKNRGISLSLFSLIAIFSGVLFTVFTTEMEIDR